MAGITRIIVAWVCALVLGSAYMQLHALQQGSLSSAGGTGSASAYQEQRPPGARGLSMPAGADRQLLNRYCVTCHNARLKTGGFALDTVDVERLADDARTWEKVIGKLRAGSMPPAGRPRPDAASVSAFVSRLETELDAAALADPDPGFVPVHRLNRAEYGNAIRDLLGLEVDASALLPADDSDHGFDNIAGVLTVSPALLERYVAAARKITREALGDLSVTPTVETYSLPKFLYQDGRMSQNLPFGSRGGLAVRHHFAVDAEYVFKVRFQSNLYNYIRGLGQPHQLEIRLDGRLVKRFSVGGEAPGRPAPVTFAGNVPGDPEWESYMHHADEGLDVRVPVQAGTRVVGVAFVDAPWEEEGPPQPIHSGFPLAVDERWFGNAAIDRVLIEGPYKPTGVANTASRQKILICRPTGTRDEEACARNILGTLARRAYRRPVTDGDLETLLGFYAAGRADGGFEGGLRRAIQRLLVDPEFIFRIEHDSGDAAGEVYRIGDIALASRLSFFLWSSIPDGELLDVAVRGKLSTPAVLEQQVRRMLADPRSKALADNFAFQWLGLRKLPGVEPNADLFPEFDENLRDAFKSETKLFFESQIGEDRSIVELLTANYTFVNDRLARHYGIPNVYGERFRRVTFNEPLQQQRGGLLGHGSILTVTSYANRTSPVLRGKWLLDNILGMPPPPPPPDVPDLKDTPKNTKPLPLRARMKEHQRNAACSVCHVHIDPLGFALENFDAVGRWRLEEESTPIDASGALADGTQFDGFAELRGYLARNREAFAHTVVERLLAYAVGRGVEYYDMAAVRKITREAAPHEYRWSAVVLGIVKSVPFQIRRRES